MNLNEQLGQAPRGGVGEILHAAVVRESSAGVPRKQAIERVASTSGRSVGSVSEAYYRVERKRSGPKRRRSSPAARPAGGRGGRRRAGSGEASDRTLQALGELEDALKVLAGIAQDQQAEIARLRADSELLGQVRRLLGLRA